MRADDMNRKQMEDEIKRVRAALEKTQSPHLKKDYSKYLKRLIGMTREYDRYMGDKNYGKTKN